MFVLLKVQSLQLSFRPAGVSLGGGGAKAPFGPPPGGIEEGGLGAFLPDPDGGGAEGHHSSQCAK